MAWIFNVFSGTFDYYQPSTVTGPTGPGASVDNLLVGASENLLIGSSEVLLI